MARAQDTVPVTAALVWGPVSQAAWPAVWRSARVWLRVKSSRVTSSIATAIPSRLRAATSIRRTRTLTWAAMTSVSTMETVGMTVGQAATAAVAAAGTTGPDPSLVKRRGWQQSRRFIFAELEQGGIVD